MKKFLEFDEILRTIAAIFVAILLRKTNSLAKFQMRRAAEFWAAAPKKRAAS
jgi:hypothetical protein